MLSRVNPNLKIPQAICICPTRELAQQNKAVLMRMGKFTGITCACAIPPAQKDYVSISRMPPITDQVIGTSGTLSSGLPIRSYPQGRSSYLCSMRQTTCLLRMALGLILKES